MENMRFKVGDRVRIKSLDWYNENKDEYGDVKFFIKEMSKFCGEIMTIKHISGTYYIMEESDIAYGWTDEMIEGLVEEKCDYVQVGNIPDVIQAKTSSVCSHNGFYGYSDSEGNETSEWYLPEGYQFTDENGNVINATKIVLEKKKKEYPKTYEECCKVMNYCYIPVPFKTTHKEELIRKFQFLLMYRDAYWKIAGEEMGLGKPWEPDWEENSEKSIITKFRNAVAKFNTKEQYTFAFPTEEMRDAFYENFKELIESCKELL